MQTLTIKPQDKKEYLLKLYVAGMNVHGLSAFENLRSICEEHISGRYEIEIIDLLKNPKLAKSDRIVALPTLVRRLPFPVRRIIGDLSDKERVLLGLDLHS